MQAIDFHIGANLHFNEEEIDKFIEHCEEVISNATRNKNTAFKLKIALHELVVNCVEHGYQKSSGKVDFFLKKSDNKLFLDVCDNGKGFNYKEFDFEKRSTSLEDISARGWGLLIINRLVEKMDIISNEPNGTRVSIVVSET